jgi:RimJ/RimL family protein N-acetyltransferase
MADLAHRHPAPALIGFRRLQAADVPLMHRWLTSPGVARWYGDGTDQPYAAIEAKYTPRIEGRSPVQPWLILFDGLPIGYIQTYPIAPFPEYAAHSGDDAGAAAIDMFIGEDGYRGRGFGATSLRAFLCEIVFADPQMTHCFIDPDPENAVAIRAYARAGFRALRRIDPAPPGEPCLLMRVNRDEIPGA